MPDKASTDLLQYPPTGDGVHRSQLKAQLDAPTPTKPAVLTASPNDTCNNILNPLKLLFLCDWSSEQETLISVAAFFFVVVVGFCLNAMGQSMQSQVLFMTGLSCGRCRSSQSRSGLDLLRQEHTHVISKGLELQTSASWDKKGKKSTSGY